MTCKHDQGLASVSVAADGSGSFVCQACGCRREYPPRVSCITDAADDEIDALRSKLETARRVLMAFALEEWSNKADWQGLCPFRRLLGCQATDGHVSAVGTPKPKPHAEHCPYFGLQAALKEISKP